VDTQVGKSANYFFSFKYQEKRHAKKLKIEKKCSWNFLVACGSD
jgi:hypothetical protein